MVASSAWRMDEPMVISISRSAGYVPAVASDARVGQNQNSSGVRPVFLTSSLSLLVAAIVAALSGFTSVASIAAVIGQAVFIVFLLAYLVSLLYGRRGNARG